jgi:hypothetical protein
VRGRQLDSSALEQSPVAGSCGHDNKSFGSIKGMKFLHQLCDYQLVKKNSAPQSDVVSTAAIL